MNLIRVGEKVVSLEKLEQAVRKILQLRASGSTQTEVAERLGIDRSFISHLEGLGELRKGRRVALVAFPVKDRKRVEELALEAGVDLAIVMSQDERESIFEGMTGTDVFNEVIDLLAELVECDVIVVAASDLRIQQAERLFGSDRVIGFSLGPSPIRTDVAVDLDMLKTLLESVITERKEAADETGRKRKFRFFKKKSRSGSRAPWRAVQDRADRD
jgi:transcriptional regulator